MKKQFLSMLVLGVIFLSSTNAQENFQKFLGRWAISFEGGMGWLEVKDVNDNLDADLLWIGGSVTPVSDVYVMDEKLIVTQIRNNNSSDTDGKKRTQTITSVLSLEGNGDVLVGKMVKPHKDGKSANIKYVYANKIPPLPAAPNLSNVKYGKPIKLIGKDMSGWRLLEPHATSGWTIEKGVLKNNPEQHRGEPHIHYGNLRTDDEFEDFNLKIKVNVPKGSNSGIYLRGIYEVQVLDSYGKELDSHNMGALYSRITPSVAAEKKAGEWQDLDITLCKRHLTVILNGVKIIDNKPVYGVTGGAITSNEFKPGPIYLQGDHGKVLYKDIILTPIISE